jgi:DnaJ-class molecular chaperone
MPANSNYFSILGISKDSSAEEIKRAYYRLAEEWHPDRNKTSGAEARFRSINQAYETLKDDELRAKYVLELGVEPEWKRQDSKNWYEAKQQQHKYSQGQRKLYAFERFVHPRNLFVLFPIGVICYFGVKAAWKSYTRIPDVNRTDDQVDAWYNTR